MKTNRFSDDAPPTAPTATRLALSPAASPTPTFSSSTSSSESDEQTASTSSESTSSSQQTSSSSSTSLSAVSRRQTSRPVASKHNNSQAMTINQNDESPGSSNASAKQYKNSPFGLTGHLTMPDSDLQSSRIFSKPHKSYDFSGADSEPEDESFVMGGKGQFVGNKSPLPARSKNYFRQNWRKASNSSESNHSHRRDDPNLQPNNLSPALSSSSGPGSFGPTQPWLLDYENKQQHANLIHSSQPKLISPHYAHEYPAPSDAGLDAKKCNAKEKGCYQAAASEPATFQLAGQAQLPHSGLPSGGGLPPIGLLHPTDSSGLLVRFSSIMYATFLVILGCILHVSELRQKSKNSSDHIYTTIVALMGIFWLVFLQMDLQRYKRYASKYILIETIFNDHKQKQLQQRRADEAGGLEPTTRSTSSSSASLVNDRMSMNTEVIFKKTAYKMYQRRAALDHHRHMNESSKHRQKMYPNGRRPTTSKSSAYSSNSHSHSDLYKSAKASLGPLPGGAGSGTDHNLVPAYKFLHGKMGANFYLKCGMAAFCFGHVIHEGLRFGQQVYFFGDNNVHCRDSAALIAHLVTPLYSFYQLFMMFKYSNLVINRHKVLARFGLMHIIGTSVTFWFRTILEEAFEDFVHKMDYFKANKPQYNLSLMSMLGNDTHLMPTAARLTSAPSDSTMARFNWTQPAGSNQSDSMAQSLLSLMSSPLSATITPQIVKHLPESYACAQNTLLTTKSMNALPYLYPFTIEYNLLLAATFLSLYFNIGKIGHSGLGNKGEPPLECSPVYTRNYPASNIQKPISVLSSGSNSQIESSDTNSSGNRMILRSNDYDLQQHQHYRDKEMGEYKSNFVVNADCHSANKGLFCGFFVLLVTLVTIVIFFVTINKPTHIQLGIKINLIQEATLTALILIVTLAGFKQVVKLNRNPYLKDKVTTDDVLMLIPLPFFFIHSLLSFRAETAAVSSSASGAGPAFSSILLQGGHHQQLQDSLVSSNGNLQSLLSKGNNNNNNNNKTDVESRTLLNNLFANHKLNGTSGLFVDGLVAKTNRSFNNNINNSNNNNNDNNNGRNNGRRPPGSAGGNSHQMDHFKLIAVGLNLIVMIEVLVQTNFIIDGMRRCSESRYLRFKKPGRELITFAIILNITYWIVATFETKSVEQYKTEIEYYGPLPYMFISHTTLPVMLFYRYHSSVCLAEIWNRAYKPPKKR